MKTYIAIIYLFLGFNLHSQDVADFENFNLSPGEFLNGSDLSGGFASGNFFLPNNYNQDFMSWVGFAISATTDTMTPGFSNQYSAITGEGAEGSLAYAVRYDFAPSVIKFEDQLVKSIPVGMYITNSTYAYHSVRDGDAFSKKFGGESGNDPDWFRITFKGYLNGQLTADSIDFFLADYRPDDNDDDYILDEWTWVDLTSLGVCDSLWLNLMSTDVGMFGMNTPAYFCLDNLILSPASSLRPVTTEEITVYPNPASSTIRVNATHTESRITIFDNSGITVFHASQYDQSNEIDISQLASGLYQVVIEDNGTIKTGMFVRQ